MFTKNVMKFIKSRLGLQEKNKEGKAGSHLHSVVTVSLRPSSAIAAETQVS